MAKRKINIQRNLGIKGAVGGQTESTSVIEHLTETMSATDIGFRPTDQRVYEINLDRILPDFSQPRHLFPFDLREAMENGMFTPAEAIEALVFRAEQNDTVALLVLGGKEKGPVEEDDTVVEDTGLFALARSIQEVGLRQPLNVYRIDDPHESGQISYRIGEGERRFWAHHLLVRQGIEEFNSVRCIVETLPDDEEIIHQRQEAENAARVDLPAIARARSMNRIKERLNIELGTRVPGENTFRLPGQRDLQIAVGQRVKSFTGRAIGDRMVRNYLALLNLPLKAQDLAEAAQLTEKQLRPVMRLKTEDEQLDMVRRIVEEQWGSRQVLQEIAPPSVAKTTLKEVSQTSVEQRFEKRILDAAKTMHALLTLPQENYEEAVTAIAIRAKDGKMRQALQSLRQTIEEVLLKVADIATTDRVEVTLLSVIPPMDALSRHIPPENYKVFEAETHTGSQVLDQLLEWRREDAVIASRLEPFFNQIEADAQKLRSGELHTLPLLEGEKNTKYPTLIVYRVISGVSIYWAHELLVKRGETQFKVMQAEIAGVTFIEDAQSD